MGDISNAETNSETNSETQTSSQAETASETASESQGVSPIEAALQIASSGVQSVSMGGRTITNANLKDLIELDRYQTEKATSSALGLGLEAGVRPGSTRF